MSESYACIVSKPGALDLARYAYSQDCLRLNPSYKHAPITTYSWAVRQGWPTPDTGRGIIHFLSWGLTGKNGRMNF